MQRNAEGLSRRKELESFQRALDVQWLNSRMEDGRMGRCLALIQREAQLEKDFQEVCVGFHINHYYSLFKKTAFKM